ncbi:hypothetical protein I7I53_03148 [Histoplasma capsulatum var. duboisii H88]|uniref:Uncharacterized protein n=1 Tax=Ajellomyces capsulatus (strain H88) TaxID=544711 RepID=A0A8A1LMW2_AJEC8|nr:hypothetical protein I7I53_03148 [Histoplasma capsulatum var. duboisii H88]
MMRSLLPQRVTLIIPHQNTHAGTHGRCSKERCLPRSSSLSSVNFPGKLDIIRTAAVVYLASDQATGLPARLAN